MDESEVGRESERPARGALSPAASSPFVDSASWISLPSESDFGAPSTLRSIAPLKIYGALGNYIARGS